MKRLLALSVVLVALALGGVSYAASVPVTVNPGDSLAASCAPGFVAVTTTAGQITAVCPTLTPTATTTSTPTATGIVNPNVDQTMIWIYNPGPMHAQIDAKLSAGNLSLTPIGTPIAEQTMIVAPRTTAVIDSWEVPGPLPTPPWIGVAEIDSNVPVTAVVLTSTPTGTPTP